MARINVFELHWAHNGRMGTKRYQVPSSQCYPGEFPAEANADVEALKKAKCPWQLFFMYQTHHTKNGGMVIPQNSAFCSHASRNHWGAGIPGQVARHKTKVIKKPIKDISKWDVV